MPEAVRNASRPRRPIVVENTIARVRLGVVAGLIVLVTVGGEDSQSYRTIGLIISVVAAAYALTMSIDQLRPPPLVATAVDLLFSLAVIASTGAGRSLGMTLLFLVLAAVALQFPRRVALKTAAFASLGLAVVVIVTPRPVLPTSLRIELAIGWSVSLVFASVLVGLLADIELQEREELVRARERVASLASQDAARRRVLRMVAHDLTAPVAAIRGMARSLENPTTRFSDEEEAEALELIIEQADHLRGFALSLQEVAASNDPTRSQPPRRERVSVGPMLENICRAESFGPTRRISFSVENDLPPIDTDPDKLRRVMVNLIDNAIRHGHTGEPVHVTASHTGTDVVVRVVDSGAGVREEDLESIFRPQWQGDDSVGEMGLGLWIVAEFVQELGGTVRAMNHETGGLDVRVSLPTTRQHDED